MGKAWDNTGIANDVELWKLALQVLKPGGHLLAFSGSRTYHRMACAIEDAGFEIRDQIQWIYGSGFPKSLDISKALDKMVGAEREVTGQYKFADRAPNSMGKYHETHNVMSGATKHPQHETAPATDLAKQWSGWGSGLKPSHEPIVMARKPLSEKNIALNVIKHGTGGINIDGCRIELPTNDPEFRMSQGSKNMPFTVIEGDKIKLDIKNPHELSTRHNASGRFPANLIHDGSEEVEAEFARYGVTKDGTAVERNKDGNLRGGFEGGWKAKGEDVGYNGKGTASRFFYCAKASKKDRAGSKHPTVKPLALMRYLCRLVTPPEGTVLDLFAGTGTTGQAALEEGFSVILIEKEAEYVEDIKRRLDKTIPPMILEWEKESASA